MAEKLQGITEDESVFFKADFRAHASQDSLHAFRDLLNLLNPCIGFYDFDNECMSLTTKQTSVSF
jgi:hypothetical protein